MAIAATTKRAGWKTARSEAASPAHAATKTVPEISNHTYEKEMSKVVLLTTIALAAACSGNSKDNTDEDISDACKTYGQQAAESDSCEDDPEAYAEICEQYRGVAHEADCGEENDALIDCANTAGYEYDCAEDGEPTIEWTEDDPCEPEFTTFLDCALSET